MQSDRNLNEDVDISVTINHADCTQNEYENLHENVGFYAEIDLLGRADTPDTWDQYFFFLFAF